MIKSAPFYWIVCDGCDQNAQEESDYASWADPDQAFIEADSAGWTAEDGKHWCAKCTAKREDAAESSPVLPSGGTA